MKRVYLVYMFLGDHENTIIITNTQMYRQSEPTEICIVGHIEHQFVEIFFYLQTYRLGINNWFF